MEKHKANKFTDTPLTIGVDGNLVAAIGLDHKFVGGLLLCDRTQYLVVQKELEERAGTEEGTNK